MNDTQRPDFEQLMRSLYGALDLALSADKLGGLWDGIGSKLSLVELGRIREAVLADVGNPARRMDVFGPKGRFGVSELWAARDRLRAAAPRPQQAPAEQPPGDPWDMARASRCGRHLCGNFPRYSHPADLPPQLSPAVLRSPDYRPHPISRELREPLYEAGRQWADAMRLQTRALGGAPNATDQEEFWRDVLADAEPQVDAIRQRHDLEPVAAARSTPARHTQPIASHMSDVIENLGADAAEAA